MTIKTSSSGAYLVHNGVILTALPSTQLGWFGTANSGASQVSVAHCKHDGDAWLMNWFDANGSSKYTSTRVSGSSSNATNNGGSPDLPCSLTYVAGTHQAARRELFWGANALVADTASVGDTVSTHTRVYIGGLFINGSLNISSGSGTQFAEHHWYNRVLNSTEAGNVRTGVVLPEAMSGWVDGVRLDVFDPGCTFTGSISGAVLTVASGLTGTVVQGRLLTGSGISADTIVGTQISGTTGGIGTYNVSVSQAAASTAITGGGVYTSMNGRIFTAYGSWTGTGVDTHPVTRAATPVVSSPAAAATGNTTANTATGGFTTDTPDGTARMVWTRNANVPGVAQVKAGQDNTGNAVGVVVPSALTITSSGVKSFGAVSVASGLTYWGYVVHTSAAGQDSTVLALGPVYPGTFRPVADVTVTGWTVTGAATHAAALNEDTASGSEYVTSPALSSTPVSEILALDKPLPAGTYTFQVQASVSAGAGFVRLSALDGSNVAQGTSADQPITTTPTTYSLTVTTTGAATRLRIEVWN